MYKYLSILLFSFFYLNCSSSINIIDIKPDALKRIGNLIIMDIPEINGITEQQITMYCYIDMPKNKPASEFDNIDRMSSIYQLNNDQVNFYSSNITQVTFSSSNFVYFRLYDSHSRIIGHLLDFYNLYYRMKIPGFEQVNEISLYDGKSFLEKCYGWHIKVSKK